MTSQKQDQAGHKKKRDRSPSYPGIDLATAIQRAELLNEKEGRHFAPTSAIVEHWGYSAKSSGGLIALAALKKFGLVDDQGISRDREARLTDLAFDIILPETEASKIDAIKHAALTPLIYRELWEQYEGRLPSTATLKYHLIRQKAFNPSAVDDFIGAFQRTIEFANLSESGIISTLEGDKPEPKTQDSFTNPSDLFEGAQSKMETKPTGGGTPRQVSEQRIVQLPLTEGRWAALQASFPMLESDWKQMLAVLEAMKLGLVSADKEIRGERKRTVTKAAIASSLTQGAREVLNKVDDGGIPLYVTDSLRTIAEENGISVSDTDTPDAVIEALRALEE